MTDKKCPLCEGPCIIKTVAMEDSRYNEVDVCSMCGAMYPRDKIIGGDEDGERRNRKCGVN